MSKSKILSKLYENADNFPNKAAVSYKEVTYSFGELLDKSKRLASAIDSQFTKRPIVVFANREAETLVFFMSIVISGNYYVPIDPEMPIEKIKSIVDDLEPVYFFGNETNKTIVTEIDGLNKFLMKDSNGPFLHETEVMDDFPLYMVFTSGSTGKPKGVLKSHKAMSSFMETFANTFDIANEVIGNQTPFYFDASAKDIYLMLETGSTLEIIPSNLFIIPPRLISYLNQKRVTFISWVPTALTLTAQMKAFQYVKPQYLKKVFFVGEIMPVRSLNYWIENLPDTRFTNLYGQSEIAGIACYYEVNGLQDENKLLPIGKPLSNCKVFLMNEKKVILEPDNLGEIVITSDALALCYLNDESNSSFEMIDGERVFHTGDYATYDIAHNIVFKARKDAQIKHLGRRIELGEIEEAANSIIGIERSCCLYDDKNKRIVLFCQTKKEVETIEGELRKKLVKYMFPEKIVVLEHMPINANGKIDRQLLKTMF